MTKFKKKINDYCIHNLRDYLTSIAFKKDVQSDKIGHLTFVSDYQMNLSLVSKLSIQAQHWSKPQVTIFPIVSYFTIDRKEGNGPDVF